MLAALAGAAAAGQVPSPATAPADFATLAKQFDYDAVAPLDVQETSRTVRTGCAIHQITYASPRADVDRTRLAYVGHSYGARWGAILTAVDRRMAAAVLMTGVPNLDCIFRRDTIPALAVLIKTWPSGQLDRYLTAQSALSAEHYIARAAPIPLLFQFGSDDHNFEGSEMERYFSLAREPRTIRWYPAAHARADPQAPVDRFAFLSGFLKISR